MSKRRGDVVFLDEFIDEIGVDAARWYLVNRGPDQTIEIDVDLAAERREKNPVYYVQYAHARIAGILRNAGGAAVVGGAARGRSAARSATSSSGSPSSPRSWPRRPSGAAPHAIPTYAIRRRRRLPPLLPRATGRVVGMRRAGVPARALPRDAGRDRARLDLVGVEAPERM